MNTGFIFNNAINIVSVVLFISGLKIITGTAASIFIGKPFRTSLYTGLGISQIGEFSFVLAVAGKASGLITDELYQIFLSSSVITMIATPFVLKIAPSVSDWVSTRSIFGKITKLQKTYESEEVPERKHDHVIIIGFGLNGKNLAKLLREAEIPYVVLEMNSDTVKNMKKKGEPIFYGDGTSQTILCRLGINRARLLVIAVSDPVSTRRIVSIARHENPDIYIIVRTRYLVEVDELKKIGADEIIPEKFETSIEIFARVLHKYSFPRNIIIDMVEKLRSNSYTALRDTEIPRRHLFEKYESLPEIEIDGFRIPEGSHLSEKTIKELQVRRKTGVTIIAVKREKKVFTNPDPNFRLKAQDFILFTGERKNMNAALFFFKGAD